MSMTLLGWRRTVSELYTGVRAQIADGGDPADAHRAWVAGRDRLFATHPDSPLAPHLRATFTGLAYAPYDPELWWTLTVDTEVEPATRDVPTGTDGVVPFRRIGRLHLPGDRGDLDVWWLVGYGGGVFVPLRDATSARTTYGGGRYLVDTVKGADLGGTHDGRGLVVDLNFAYQPSCAYDPRWACPLASPGNTLPGEVVAGEQYLSELFFDGLADEPVEGEPG